MITDIKIQDQSYSLDWGYNLWWLSKINIFVWANNSWKSRFLRNIFSTGLEYLPNDLDLTKIKDFISDSKKLLGRHKWRMYHQNILSYIDSLSEINHIKENSSSVNINNLKNTWNIKVILNELNWFIENNINWWWTVNWEHFLKTLKKYFNNYWIKNLNIKNYHFKKVYIPMLRWLRWFGDYLLNWNDLYNIQHNIKLSLQGSYPPEDKDIYSARTRKDYHLWTNETPKNIDVFTWLTLYEDIKEMLLWDLEKRELVKEYENFLWKNFFEWQKISLIPKLKNSKWEENNVLYIKVWGNSERAIYDLWDWLQTIIINTFPLFKYKWEDLLLFIEEPEMTLHPWIQRKLLEVFNQFDNVQYFITTHSNHLLDISLDFNENISTYSFEKIESKKFEINNKTENKRILDILGVRNSSVFLSNCIIWVEWISDRLYIKKFLELYQKSLWSWEKIFEEDKHFSILEYGGWNITHFNFWNSDDNNDTTNVEAIQKNNFMVADNDWNLTGTKIKTTDENWKEIEKWKRLEELNEIFWNNVFFEHREIENILGKDLFEKYCKKFLSDKESRKEIKFDLRDENNIDWKNKKIWEILKNHFISPKDNVNIPKYYKDWTDLSVIWESKPNFSRDIINIINEEKIKFQDLDEIAQKLIENIYKFIKENNN